jgi:hypothetical protein
VLPDNLQIPGQKATPGLAGNAEKSIPNLFNDFF